MKTIQDTNNEWGVYHFYIGQLILIVKLDIKEFKKITLLIKEGENVYKLDMRRVYYSYMELIILRLCTIFGDLQCDQINIKKVKKWLEENNLQQFVSQLASIEESDNEEYIHKINNNRNKLIGHLDVFKKPFYKLKFSPDSGRMPEFTSNTIRDQRYELEDIENDLPRFEGMLNEYSKILNDINQHLCNQK